MTSRLTVVFFFALISRIAVATGGLSGLPVLNGIIPTVPSFPGMKTRIGQFIHPGIWHTHDDLERMRLSVEKGEEPYASAFLKFSADTYSAANYSMQGPKQVICRGSCSNYTTFSNDARAAWQNSIMWYITRDEGHWSIASTILDSWGTNLTDVVGTDTSLLVALDGDLFVNAAEIMRWEGGWIEKGAKASGTSGFANQLYWLFARQSIIIGQANYGLASIKALLSFSVYLDDVAMYNYALNAYQNDLCAGVLGNWNENGQGAETGRDQGHATTGLGWAAEAARVAQSQGHDVYALYDNLILKGAEYTAKYNLGHEVPYDPRFYRCEAILVNGPWDAPSNISRGAASGPHVWDIFYYQYVVKRGLHAPYVSEAKSVHDAAGGEQTGNGKLSTDHPMWGDLIWSYPSKGKFLNDNGRTIWGGGKIGASGIGNHNS